MRQGLSMGGKWIIFLGILMLVGEVLVSLQTEKRGPYEMAIRSYETCHSDVEYQIASNPKLRKKSRTLATVEGTFYTNITINNEIKVRAVIQQLTPNGWKDNYMNFDFGKKGACQIMEEFFDSADLKRMANNLMNENGTKVEEFCNLSPGLYTVEPMELRLMQFKDVPVFFYGSYRLRAMGFMHDFNGREISCGLVYFEILRKLKRNG